MSCTARAHPENNICSLITQNYFVVVVGNGNGLLFHMTQPTSRSTIKAIACSKPTISEN